MKLSIWVGGMAAGVLATAFWVRFNSTSFGSVISVGLFLLVLGGYLAVRENMESEKE